MSIPDRSAPDAAGAAARPIVLLGIKHSGKSSLGRRLARALTRNFADTDEEILGRAAEKRLPVAGGMPGVVTSVRELYRALGVDGFSALETEALGALLKQRGLVIASGGGLADNSDALKLLGDGVLSVFLDAPESLLYERVIKQGIPPFLDPTDPAGSFSILYSRRRAVYSGVADIHLELGDMDIDTAFRALYELVTAEFSEDRNAR